jgi:Tol biopolymer transport system component
MKVNFPHPHKTLISILFSVFFLVISINLPAQYFGRNKVNYRQFDFKVLESPHFEIYHYLGNVTVKNRIAQQSEQWYQMHQQIFKDTFKVRNPVILYNNHADFQQTNAVSGLIGVGTGGVTEGLKNRVIMPFMESNAQTDHVLGHELVHAFQYHLFRESDSLSMNALNNLPLWMIEGLAEYMSIGYIDPHTAIWLRSAVLNNKLPTIKLLNNRPDEYFPYRWGQAFWAYVTGVWGDDIIKPLFIATGKYGYEDAFRRVLGVTDKIFSEKWKEALQAAYSPLQQNASVNPLGTQIIGKNNSGKINIVPSISPDGKMMAFWSEKDIFNLDLFLADATTGKVIQKLTSTSFASHIDEFSSYESAVAWSPDSRQVAFVVFTKGRNRLLTGDIQGKVTGEFDIPGVEGFSNPAWSPDGKTIVVTGLVDGQSDLYAFNLDTKTVKQLTNDRFAELTPSWSSDGKWLAFSTDRNSFKKIQHRFSHDLAVMNYSTGEIQTQPVFTGANNLNPVFGSDNSTLYFLSDRDGFRNLYSYNVQSKELIQLSELYTGITGITLYAPAISASRQTDQVLYTYYNKDEYSIYSVNANGLPKRIVENKTTNMPAAMLPPTVRTGSDIVQNSITNPSFTLADEALFVDKPYRAKFKLDYLGNTGMGVTTGGFTSGVSGGINGIFSDILGNHQLFGSIAINGEVYDFGGQFAYINADKRLNWGASISHVPYLSGIQRLFLDTLVLNGNDTTEVANLSTDILRTFEDQLSLFAAYPFSQTRRVEGGASFARYYYRLDRYSDFYTTDLNFFIGNRREKLPTPGGFNFGQGYLAFVEDNSQFGVASPLIGHRFRLEGGQYFGVVNLQSLLGDYRKYFRLPPFTLATRNMYMGRFGKDAESGVLPPLYIGYPFFIRGYEATNFAEQSTGEEVTINDLIGSKIFVTNAELRFPFTGPERLSAIRSRFFLSELNLFTDGGIAWGSPGSPTSDPKNNLVPRDSKFILSSGISLRINLFGYVVIEPYYAVPWQNGGFGNANFGLNFMPGW